MQKIYYSVNLKTRQCYRIPLYNETFRPIGVPFDAKPGGTGVIGTSALEGAGVAVDSWYSTTDGEHINFLQYCALLIQLHTYCHNIMTL